METGEIGDIVLGKKLGYGANRSVYECAIDRSLVIKVAHSNWSRQHNIIEYRLWFDVAWDEWHAKWFAPCVSISEQGGYLVQRRAEMIPIDQYPSRIPAHFQDLKYANFGLYDRRFVCFDYAGLSLSGGLTKRMKRVTWKSE